ncbi:tripeptidyl peptidase A [Mycena olivaceomarginata]|nr:tripeptidyl peptidase A [Mycena olivaceomarginata]
MAPTLLWCSVFTAFLAASATSLVKDSLPEAPSGWTELQHAQLSPSRGLNLRFGLAQPGFSRLESLLQNISDPSHPDYGNHLSKEQVHALSKPSSDALELVEGWLVTHNASSVKWSASKDTVTVVLPVFSAEEMLSTRFGVFEHLKSGTRVVRTLSYSLPQDLVPHVAWVHPTTAFLDPLRHGMGKFFSGDEVVASPHLEKRPVALNQSDFTSCVSIVDPPCVLRMYNIGNYTPAIVDGSNRIGVAGYLDIWARPESLKLYLNEDDYIPESIGSNYTMEIVNITGPFTANPTSGEGNLDTVLLNFRPESELTKLCAAIQVAYPIPMTYYSTSSVPPYIPDKNQDGELPGVNEPYLDFIDYVLGLDEPPTVITTSYGDDEQTDYANAVCQGFAELGARGVSVLFSTGDQGLGVDDLPTCIANTGNNATTFLPVFLASCPYVTSVGETEGFFPQTAIFASGAGFSYYFDRPSYQDAAVSAYLNGSANSDETALQSSMYNHQGRAYPDISCIGSGTSAAAPTAAGIVALLNDWRLRHGKPTMGFLNPFLYSAGLAGLVDITDGFVHGCEQPGFNATKGWDPATGLGYFDFEKLQSLVL